VAHALQIPLTTAQSILQRLATRGVVHVTKRKSRSVYEAKDPIVFKSLLEQQLQDISAVIPLLRTIRVEASGPAQIRVYARERITDIFRQALTTKQKMVYEIVSAREFQESSGERFHFTRRRVAESIRLKSLRVERNEIKRYNQRIHERELREARFLPKELTFKCSILFWDETLAFLTPPSEGLAWVVRSAAMRETFQQLFDLLWSVSRRMETMKDE
jgi:hypothetical protein